MAVRPTLVFLIVVVVGTTACHPSASQTEGAAAETRTAATSVPVSTAPSSEWLKPVTAKVYLSKARELAKAWHADADLYDVSTSYALPDGTANPKTESSGYQTAWEYRFCSKQANKVLMVDVTEKGIQTSEDYPPVPPAALKFLSDDFVDSDRVMQAGRAAGWKLDAYISMELSCFDFAKPAWDIVSASTHNFVDGVSGKVI